MSTASWWTTCKQDDVVMAPLSVDLNADVGEATEADGIAVERELLSVVTSVNVACGGHAGDEASMRNTVEAACAHGVAVGAHPSYPDRPGFGRRPMDMDRADLEHSLRDQMAALVEVCSAQGTQIRSVKAHGALYGVVGQGADALGALLAAVDATCAPDTVLVLPARSEAVRICRSAGRLVRQEGFCDRAYAPDGTLVDRSLPGAVFTDPVQAAAQAVELAGGGQIDTLCIHGDSPGAVAMARAVRQALERAGMVIGPATT
jgi:5-oxoprolinase (ATP-hydrolysing) subunit A